MSTPVVLDVTTSITEPRSVRERVLHRLRLLRQWRKDGIPPGCHGCLPRSLNDARKWNAPELGIQPIGSKADFVTKHPDWGAEVLEISLLLKELSRLYQPLRAKKSSRSEAVEARQETQKIGVLLEQVTAQWHKEREATLSALREVSVGLANYADLNERYKGLLGLLRNREQEIMFLRKQLENQKP